MESLFGLTLDQLISYIHLAMVLIILGGVVALQLAGLYWSIFVMPKLAKQLGNKWPGPR